MKIANIKKMERGCLKGFFDLIIEKNDEELLRICECRIVHEPGKKAFIQPPQQEYEWNGKRKYKPIVKFSEHFKAKVERLFLNEFYNMGIL